VNHVAPELKAHDGVIIVIASMWLDREVFPLCPVEVRKDDVRPIGDGDGKFTGSGDVISWQ